MSRVISKLYWQEPCDNVTQIRYKLLIIINNNKKKQFEGNLESKPISPALSVAFNHTSHGRGWTSIFNKLLCYWGTHMKDGYIRTNQSTYSQNKLLKAESMVLSLLCKILGHTTWFCFKRLKAINGEFSEVNVLEILTCSLSMCFFFSFVR